MSGTIISLNTNRNFSIDFLRAISILGVIAIHVFSYHLSSSFIFLLWDKLQWVVVGFVLCSGFVLEAHYSSSLNTITSVMTWYKKRLTRLLVPYYIFLFILVLIMGFWQFNYIAQSIFLVGGVDENWLVLLFIQLTILSPFLLWIFRKKQLFLLYSGLLFILSFYFTIVSFPYDLYKYYQFLPWSGIFLIGMYLAKTGNKKLKILLVWSLVFLGVTYFLKSYLVQDLVIRNNKYPPNMYYLSFSLIGSVITLLIAPYFEGVNLFRKLVDFFSKNSYALFFIHLLILKLLQTKNIFVVQSVWIQLVLVLILSVGGVVLVNKIIERLQFYKFQKR